MRFVLWKIDQPNNKTHIFFTLPNVGLGSFASRTQFSYVPGLRYSDLIRRRHLGCKRRSGLARYRGVPGVNR
jgi:hypothetical protein